LLWHIAKEEGKSRDELEKIVDKLLERFAKRNPKWLMKQTSEKILY